MRSSSLGQCEPSKTVGIFGMPVQYHTVPHSLLPRGPYCTSENGARGTVKLRYLDWKKKYRGKIRLLVTEKANLPGLLSNYVTKIEKKKYRWKIRLLVTEKATLPGVLSNYVTKIEKKNTGGKYVCSWLKRQPYQGYCQTTLPRLKKKIRWKIRLLVTEKATLPGVPYCQTTLWYQDWEKNTVENTFARDWKGKPTRLGRTWGEEFLGTNIK